MPTRRQVLKGAGAGLALAAVGPLAAQVGPPTCVGPASGVLQAIDAHCHVFNGTDLQVAGFINTIKLGVGRDNPFARIGRWVQEHAWANAPTAARELDWLRRRGIGAILPPVLGSQAAYSHTMGAVVTGMGKDSDEVFDDFLNWLAESHPEDAAEFAEEVAKRDADAAPAIATTLSGAKVLDVFKARDAGQTLISSELALGGRALVTFLKTFFRYRMENIWTMQQVYGCDSVPSLALLCPAMVDFDLWIGDRNRDQGRTPSSVESQLKLMQAISLATQGRVHALAPFNPLRAACDPSYVDLSRRAIDEFGCLGFKLYPPMGFRAIGNPDPPVSGTSRMCPGNAQAVKGARLDEVLIDFYRMCAERGVPIMAHSASSNGPSSAAEAGASPAHWRTLIERHPELFKTDGTGMRISLGHMGGDVDDLDSPSAWRSETVELIKQFPGIVYADLSYYEHMLSGATTRRKLAALLSFLKTDQDVENGVMYGSDWSMLATQAKADRYLSSFRNFIWNDIGLQDDARVQKLLSGNAKRFFAIEQGQPGHVRLKQFHEGDTRPAIPFLHLETR